MFYLYVIENQDRELYFGSTNDLKRRLGEHVIGKSFATKGSNWKLIYYEAYASEIDARAREQRIKHFGQSYSQLKKRIKNSRRLAS
jgi:predicted GIY-YIG superfamily endonuclease